jgi:mono/diheme cytochrome c family protein
MGRRMRRAAIAALLTTMAAADVGADAPAPPSSSASSDATAGQKLYARHCLSCHQADGRGVPDMQPAIAGGSWVKGDPQPLALFVLTGGFDSAGRKESDVENVMPPFAQLSDEDLAAILTFIRAKFGGGASAVTAAQVSEARATLPAH